MKLVDASPAALCNAFRYNYGDLEGCTMLLDIGAKTSNLLFFEKGKVYSRSINIGANSITQDFANESKLKFPKRRRSRLRRDRSAWAALTRSRKTRKRRPLPRSPGR
jgi:type IV pilus assembly protein PilM